MKLLIISNMMHHELDDRIVGHGPTARELSYLAQLFNETRHIGCLHTDAPTRLELPYVDDQVELIPLPPSGGNRFIDKLQIMRHTWKYLRTIYHQLPWADVVHVRCPANIPLLAIIVLALWQKPHCRWIKYAGNWKPVGSEPLSFAFQRWWLRRNFSRAQVTVNGQWNDSPPHVTTFYNPCLTDDEVHEGVMLSQQKVLRFPLKLLFVGNLNVAKGIPRVLEIAHKLKVVGVEFELKIIGDGPDRESFMQQAHDLGIDDAVSFLGALPRQALNRFYAEAHFILLPTAGEGWPKVLSEAMAYGVVPLASAVSSIPQYLDQFGVGRAIPLEAIGQYVQTLVEYSQHPERWKKESEAALEAVHLFTYSFYLKAVERLLNLPTTPSNNCEDNRVTE